MRIGLFDSGIGGLTVLKTFIKKYPNNEYIYYGDTKNVPYGSKPKEELLELSPKIIKFLENKKVDIIIIACGTVSSNIYQELKNITTIPIYSIIEEIPYYIKEKNYKNILLIATEATIKSKAIKIENVIQLATPKLVPLIERNQDVTDSLKEYFKDIPKIDALILGCTHYPIIKEKIKEQFNYEIDIIDMSEILIKKINIIDSTYKVELYFSKVNETIKQNSKKILGEVCQNYQK